MARIDLNIVDRGTKGTDWIAEDGCLTPQQLDEVLEQKTDNSGALNSLPTPFARFFVAREAFRRAMEERINRKTEAGFAYRQMVSDILDVYELLFNLKYHKNIWGTEREIEIREWDSNTKLEEIRNKMPVLYNSLNEYYKTDVNEEKLHFIVFTQDGKDLLLACTSPITGFITPPDMDKALVEEGSTKSMRIVGEQYLDLHIRRKSRGEYFSDALMFEDRDEEFKNYMFNEVFGSDAVDEKFKAIKEYIRSFKNDPVIRKDYKLGLGSVKTDQKEDLVVNGLRILSYNDIDVNSYFTPSIIKVPYRISRELFEAVVYENDFAERDEDYLLPFKPEVLALFKDNKIESSLKINRDSVTVLLKYDGKVYKKNYSKEPMTETDGRIIDLKEVSISFDMGIFPNILSSRDNENNYFKVILLGACNDSDSNGFSVDDISVQFYKGKEQIKELDPRRNNARFGVCPAVTRTNDKKCGTKFYEVFNTDFNALEIDIRGHKGLLLPKFKKSEMTSDSFTYAIDFGTSNTFISRCKHGNDNLPEMFRMEHPMVNYLHEIPEDSQISLVHRIENGLFAPAQGRVKTEFAPVFIDGRDYSFPIRTAMCGQKGKGNNPRLFDNHNIAFFYEKVLPEEDQIIYTDLKWEDNEAMLRVFIRELLLIIKADVLQRNGDLSLTQLVWFRPLSFMANTRETYNEIWTTEAEKILSIQENQISCYSESEAPYYFFKKKNYIKDTEIVTVVDIGGGSTDFVYFKYNQPVMANSVHFGCDVLWENGYNEFDNERENGIFRRYETVIKFEREDLEDLNSNFLRIESAKTKDIINFWLSNSNYCDISKRLKKDFKPVFIYHLTSLLFYMASMYQDYKLDAPRSVLFSGNGSKYIDSFISSDKRIIKKIVDLTFEKVFGEPQDVKVELPSERKEATCYGGLYRAPHAPAAGTKVYHGDVKNSYVTVGDVNENMNALREELGRKYDGMNSLYEEILKMLRAESVIDSDADINQYISAAREDLDTPLRTYYQSQVKERYKNDDASLFDSVFFLPIKDRVFELTKLDMLK
jgi:hypothetical protein